MGYHRPLENFNIGKKSEHYSRKHFSEHGMKIHMYSPEKI